MIADCKSPSKIFESWPSNPCKHSCVLGESIFCQPRFLGNYKISYRNRLLEWRHVTWLSLTQICSNAPTGAPLSKYLRWMDAFVQDCESASGLLLHSRKRTLHHSHSVLPLLLLSQGVHLHWDQFFRPCSLTVLQSCSENVCIEPFQSFHTLAVVRTSKCSMMIAEYLLSGTSFVDSFSFIIYNIMQLSVQSSQSRKRSLSTFLL